MKRLILAIVAVGVLVSCAKEMEQGPDVTPEQQTLMTKLVGGTQGELIPGSLLVKLDEKAVSAIGRDGSGVFDGIEGLRISPALPVQPKNMEVARKYGLHQWFSVEFDPQIKTEVMASRLAAAPEVKSLQYTRYVEPVTDGKALPFDMPALTKSQDDVIPKDAEVFNDPYYRYQWNLVNDGSIAEDAVPGADVGVRDAWKLTAGEPSVVVAVFDCAVNSMHPDLADALWQNEAEVNGTAGKDDDGNGYIDDKYGFNFVGCFRITEDFASDRLDGKKIADAIQGNALNWSAGSGHGTHVAGIIGATNNNGKGVSSIAGGSGNGDGVRLMTCQIFEGSKSTSDAQSAAAYVYAADNGACIAQCSYGTSTIITDDDTYINGNGVEDRQQKIEGSPLENAALKYFLDPANCNHEALERNIAIFAAGNHSNPYSGYPGALPYVISVTSFGVDYLPAGYTNYGPGCKIAAPGGEMSSDDDDEKVRAILSTGVSNAAQGSPGAIMEDGRSDGQYVYMQGTSMACPHVSGVVALGISYAAKLGKKLTDEQLKSYLLTSVNDIDQFCTEGSKTYMGKNISLSQYYGNMGTGAVDAWRFLMAIEGTPSVLVKKGEKAVVSLDDVLGESVSKHLDCKVSMDQADMKALGLAEVPVIKDGKLELTCTALGSGKLTITSATNTTSANGKEHLIGKMEFSRELSIVSRPYAAANGGWF